MTGQTITDLTVGKYDVVIDAGPSYQTQRIEAADGMLRFMQTFPQAGIVIAPRLAKVLDWPEAQEIAAELQQLLQPGQDPNAEMDQQKAQLDLEGKQLVNQQRTLNLVKELQGAKQEMYAVAQQAVADTLRSILSGPMQGRPQ